MRMEGSKPANGCRESGSRLGALVCALSLLTASILAGELHSANPHEVMAGYLRALPAYVAWPTNIFTSPQATWQIGILGDDPFGATLEMVLSDRQAAGRGFQIQRAADVKELSTCEIVFIALKDEHAVTNALAELAPRPVLTVGEANNFLENGGMIQLQAHGTIHMSVNLDRTRAAHLEIPTRMLELANEVIESGVRKKLR
jgi:hypothetical protein